MMKAEPKKQASLSQGIHWSSIQERGSLWGIRFMVMIYRVFGRAVFSLFLYPVMAYFFITGRTARRASMAYLKRIYRIEPECLAGQRPGLMLSFAHFLTFGQVLLDKFLSRMGHISPAEVNACYGSLLDDIVTTKQGAIFFGSHLGNMELCGALSNLNPDVKINALMLTDNAEKFNRSMQELSPEIDVTQISVNRLGPDTLMQLNKKLEQGEIVVIVCDRTSATQPGRSQCVDFLGEPAPFPEGAFILAGLLDCPVYLLFCIKEKKQYNIYLEFFSTSLKLPRAKRQQQLQQVISLYADRLGFYCCKAPLQWFNFFDFWHRGDAVERKS